jgi:DNA mismatch endonuclease (patch repair protein)
MDTISKQQRSRNMSRIRSKNTEPEIIVRKALTKYGMKYRLHLTNLPGSPDIVLTKKRIAIFINGCFWHQHEGCKRKSMPKTNTEYWNNKLSLNIERQNKNIANLKSLGWKTGIVWECQTKDENTLDNVLSDIINA